MNIMQIHRYSEFSSQSDCNRWTDSYYESKLKFSLRNLTFVGDISNESIMEALQRSMCICKCAGIDSRHHYKQIYIYDPINSVLQMDWLMSKAGFNLVVIQIPSLNEKMSKWIWKLAEEKVSEC